MTTRVVADKRQRAQAAIGNGASLASAGAHKQRRRRARGAHKHGGALLSRPEDYRSWLEYDAREAWSCPLHLTAQPLEAPKEVVRRCPRPRSRGTFGQRPGGLLTATVATADCSPGPVYAPGDSVPPVVRRRRAQTACSAGSAGLRSTMRRPSLVFEEVRAAHREATPGPGAYDVLPEQRQLKEVQRLFTAPLLSDLDFAREPSLADMSGSGGRSAQQQRRRGRGPTSDCGLGDDECERGDSGDGGNGEERYAPTAWWGDDGDGGDDTHGDACAPPRRQHFSARARASGHLCLPMCAECAAYARATAMAGRRPVSVGVGHGSVPGVSMGRGHREAYLLMADPGGMWRHRLVGAATPGPMTATRGIDLPVKTRAPCFSMGRRLPTEFDRAAPPAAETAPDPPRAATPSGCSVEEQARTIARLAVPRRASLAAADGATRSGAGAAAAALDRMARPPPRPQTSQWRRPATAPTHAVKLTWTAILGATSTQEQAAAAVTKAAVARAHTRMTAALVGSGAAVRPVRPLIAGGGGGRLGATAPRHVSLR